MRRLIFADTAEAELEAIGDHTAQDNPSRAVTFIQDLRESCAKLIAMPERHPLIRYHQSMGIRRRVHGNYLIFYRIETDRVEILHILHGAMDYDAVLFPES